MYGERTDRLNAGVPSDRLIVRWNVEAEPPAPLSFDAVSELPRMIELKETPRHCLVPVAVRPICQERTYRSSCSRFPTI